MAWPSRFYHSNSSSSGGASASSPYYFMCCILVDQDLQRPGLASANGDDISLRHFDSLRLPVALTQTRPINVPEPVFTQTAPMNGTGDGFRTESNCCSRTSVLPVTLHLSQRPHSSRLPAKPESMPSTPPLKRAYRPPTSSALPPEIRFEILGLGLLSTSTDETGERNRQLGNTVVLRTCQ